MRQYRKYAMLFLCAGVFAVGITGCKKKDSGLDRIKNAGELKVAVYKQDAKSEELCSRVAQNLGVTVTYLQASSQTEALEQLSGDQADMVMGELVETQPLQDGLTMSDPYLLQNWYVVTARGDYSDSMTGFKDRIVALSDEVPDEGFRWSGDVTNVNFVGVQSDKVAAALEQDALDGYVCLEDEAVRITDTSSDVQMQRLRGVDPVGYAAATRTSDRQIGALLKEEIQQLQNEAQTENGDVK